MTRPRPVDWRVVRDGIRRWFRDVSGVDTIWANQAAPQPRYPYASLNILGPGPSGLGIHAGQVWQTDGSLNLVKQREFVVSCQVHVGAPDNNEPDCDSIAIGESVTAALALPSTIQAFIDAGVALRDNSEPTSFDLVVGSEWVSRSQFELRFGLASVMTPANTPQLDDVGYFDKVEVSSTIDGLANPGGSLELDDEILDPSA